jgi:small-conductance mechanosensitive channel
MADLKKLKITLNLLFLALFIIFIIIYLILKFPTAASTIPGISIVLYTNFLIYLPKIIIVMLIIILTRIFIRFTLKNIEKNLEKKGMKQDLLLFKGPYKVIVWFVVILISLSIIFKNFASLITSLGLIGFGITFALQKPILNFVGWLTIISKRPYWVGDRVMIGTVKGDVFDMNIMYTSLSEFSFAGDEPAGRSITIPNEYVLTQPVVNYTHGSSLIWDIVELTITYKSDWKEASMLLEESTAEIVGEIMKANAEKWKQSKHKFTILGKDIVDKPKTRIDFSENFIKVRCHYIVESRKRGSTKSKIMDRVLENLKKTKHIELAINKTYVPS